MQEMLNLSQNFWTNKYETNKIGWDSLNKSGFI